MKNQTVWLFGEDQTGTVEYQFNSAGFRSPDITKDSSVIVIGNTVTFGLALPFDKTFGCILAKNLGLPLINLSFGCYFHENHDHLINIACLAQRSSHDIVVIQINNLDRCRKDQNHVIGGNDREWCRNRFIDYFDQTTALLANKKLLWIYWDDRDHDLPSHIQKQILINNKGHLDHSLPNMAKTFGNLSHQFVAKRLCAALRSEVDQKN